MSDEMEQRAKEFIRKNEGRTFDTDTAFLVCLTEFGQQVRLATLEEVQHSVDVAFSAHRYGPPYPQTAIEETLQKVQGAISKAIRALAGQEKK